MSLRSENTIYMYFVNKYTTCYLNSFNTLYSKYNFNNSFMLYFKYKLNMWIKYSKKKFVHFEEPSKNMVDFHRCKDLLR